MACRAATPPESRRPHDAPSSAAGGTVSAAYQALLREGDQYLEEAQRELAGAEGSGLVKGAHFAAAHAALAQALYARAALEKPDASGQLFAMLAAAKAASENQDASNTVAVRGDSVTATMDRHPAGKKRAHRKVIPDPITPRGAK